MIDLCPYFIELSGKYLRKEYICLYMCVVYPESKIWLATKNKQKFIFKCFDVHCILRVLNYFAT